MSNITFSISVDSQMMGDGDSDPISADLQTRIYYQSGGPDLDLSLCGISTVDKGLLDCIREHHGPVTSLNLAYNRIRSLSPHFVTEMCSSLRTLDLSRNQLKWLPDDFGELEQLVFLDIHQNKLQSLPLSMGKMTRLTYLNLSDNPFDPPLRDYLEFERRVHNGEKGVVDAAHSLISFLAKVSQQSSKTKHTSRILATPSPPPPPPVQRQRTVTFVEESSNNNEKSKSTLTHSSTTVKTPIPAITETAGIPVDDEIKEDEFIPKQYTVKYSKSNLGPYLKKKKPNPKKDPSWLHPKEHHGWGHTLAIPTPKPVEMLPEQVQDWKMHKIAGCLMFLVWLLMFPVMMAMVYETTAVDHLVKGNEYLEPLWKNYRPYHEGIEYGLEYIGLSRDTRGLVVRGPAPKKSKYYDFDPFTAMFYALREAFASFFKSLAEFIDPDPHPV